MLHHWQEGGLGGQGGVLLVSSTTSFPQGMPSSARLYTPPNYSVAVCNKSFFNADKVVMTWNKQGG